MAGALVALELSLVRCFSVSHHHHFTALAVSTALLGWGCSGALLRLISGRRFGGAWVLLTLSSLSGVSVPLCFRAVQGLQVDLEFITYRPQLLLQVWLAGISLMVPFLLGALFLGRILQLHSERSGLIYGAQMLGSGLGGAGITLCMWQLPPVQLLRLCVACAGTAGLPLCLRLRRRKKTCSSLLAMSALLGALSTPSQLVVAPHKDLARIRDLLAQKQAARLGTRHSPRGQFATFESPFFHTTLFASLTAQDQAPDQAWLLRDGERLSPVFQIDSPQEASILTTTPAEVAYRLRRPQSVALLDETGGVATWLSRFHGCGKIWVVQQEQEVIDLVREVPGTQVYLGDQITIIKEDSRVFLERKIDSFDLIHLGSAHGPAAGVSSLLALRETPLLTVEGVKAAWNRLNPQGLLLLVRGLQTPGRDNVKWMATAVHALEELGVEDPGRHLIQVRNYLAAGTLLSRCPFTSEEISTLTSVSEELLLDIPWAPGVPKEAGMKYDVRLNSRGKPIDEYGLAARSLLAGGAERRRFYRSWPWYVVPARDDRPFFFRFFRWGGISWIRALYGPHWTQNAELGPLFLALLLGQAILMGILFLLLPAWLLDRFHAGQGLRDRSLFWERKRAFFHVTFLGLGYMGVEMGAIHVFTCLWGDPVLSAATVVSLFLVLSGLGGISGKGARSGKRIPFAIAFLVFLFALGWRTWKDPSWMVLISLLIPCAFCMGRPFPAALRGLRRAHPGALAWAWGINGMASVVAASGALLVSVFAGISVTLVLGSFCYVGAFLTAEELDESLQSSDRFL